jgi:hypothetical protein
MAIVHKVTSRPNALPTKFFCFFNELTRPDLKSHMEIQGTQTLLKCEGLTLSDSKIYCKATVIMTMRSWQKDRHRNQWGKTENLK